MKTVINYTTMNDIQTGSHTYVEGTLPRVLGDITSVGSITNTIFITQQTMGKKDFGKITDPFLVQVPPLIQRLTL